MTIRIHKNLVKQELLSPVMLGSSLMIAVLYLFSTALLLNARLVGETLTGTYTLSYKLGILTALLLGVRTMYTPLEMMVMLLLGVLTGMNLVLVIRSLREQQRRGMASFGLGMFGVVASTGCASCGLTLFSVAAPTISLSVAPFQGPLLQLTSFVLLTASLIHTVNRRAAVCTLKQ